MLKQVAEGVLVHVSEFLLSNSTVVKGPSGVLLIDPGITADELAHLASDISELGQPVVVTFSTHPDWDHTLWHANFGDAPRYGTARNAAAMAELLANPEWQTLVAGVLPPEHADEIPMELLGLITALPAGATEVPWDGPRVRIIEHQAHAAGHAALLIEESRVLVAGDMLSDILMPVLDLDADDPIGDYLDALQLLEGVAHDIDVVIPGHGTVGGSADLLARIAQDRAYVESLRDGTALDDPRLDPTGEYYWLVDVHNWQVQRLNEKRSTSN